MAKRLKHFTFITVLLLAFLYVPNAFAELTISNYSLQSKERASRTEYSYTYKADITNSGDAVENTTATVSSLSTNTKIVADSLTFGAVGLSETVTSSDSFTITQNRKFPFNPDDLIWNITADPAIPNLPPDPGEEGKATLEGIDSDNDGVRDDVQRYILITYYDESEELKAAVLDYAKLSQSMLVDSSDKNKSISHAEQYFGKLKCLRYHEPINSRAIAQKIRALSLNTEKRFLANVKNSSHLSGQSFSAGILGEDLYKYCQ